MAGIFLYGLRDDSRTKMKMAGERYNRNLIINTLIHDRLAALGAALCGDKRKPTMLSELLFAEDKEERPKAEVFKTPEDFLKAYKDITKEG